MSDLRLCLLHQGHSCLHILAELQEFVSCCSKFDWFDVWLLWLITWLRCHGFAFKLRELFNVYVHSNSDIDGFDLSCFLWLSAAAHTWSNEIVEWVLHVNNLGYLHCVLLQYSANSLMLLTKHFHERICILNCKSKLNQIFGENLLSYSMFDCLYK